MQEPIELYYWPTPNGWKITIALEEMGLAYRTIPVNIGQGDQFKPHFLALNPNNKMPAILDPEGPDGAPISVFESGAILLYLARKSGLFYPRAERARVEVEQWLMWQMGGLGPMTGQAVHFRFYAPAIAGGDAEKVAYGLRRYTHEVNRLFGVMERRLADRDYLAGDYSIADMAAWPWAMGHERLGLGLDEFPKLKGWLDRIAQRPAVQRGMAVGKDIRQVVPSGNSPEDEKWRKTLFLQTAKSTAEAIEAARRS